MSNHLTTAALVTLAALLVAPSAFALDVFVNGTKVTGGIRGIALEQVNVKFDDQGNVHIDAPGYNIQVVDPGSGAPAGAPAAGAAVAGAVAGAAAGMARTPSVPPAVPSAARSGDQDDLPPPGSMNRPPAGGAPVAPVAAPPVEKYWLIITNKLPGQYKVLVQVNGKQVADIPAVSPQYIQDLTEMVTPGNNAVQLTYLPVPGAPPAAAGMDAIEVMIGRGITGADGTLTIKRVLGTHKHKSGSPSADASTLNFSR